MKQPLTSKQRYYIAVSLALKIAAIVAIFSSFSANRNFPEIAKQIPRPLAILDIFILPLILIALTFCDSPVALMSNILDAIAIPVALLFSPSISKVGLNTPAMAYLTLWIVMIIPYWAYRFFTGPLREGKNRMLPALLPEFLQTRKTNPEKPGSRNDSEKQEK